MKVRLFAFVVAAVAALAGSHALAQQVQARYDGNKVVRATVRTDKDLERVLELTDDVWSHRVGLGQIDFRVTPDQFRALQATGVPFVTLIDDVQAKIEAERIPAAVERGATWFSDYKSTADYSAYVNTLVALRPDLASRVSVGTSLLGREIFGIKITSPGGSNKPAAVFNGCQHAREWVAATTPMYIADQLIRTYDTDPQTKRMVDNVEFYIIPIVNPDGYEFTRSSTRLWRKNRRTNGDGTFGVDLNRNWGYQWGGSGASPVTSDDTYRGPSAFSEPETMALRDFILAHPNTRAHIDFHSYSQLVLAPWAYTTADAPDGSWLTPLSQQIAAAFSSVYNNTYVGGPTGQILYLAAGASTDWTYGAEGIVGYGVELRDTGANGFLLPPAQIIPTGEEAMAGVKTLIDAMLSPLDFSETGLPAYATPSAPTPVSVGVNPTFGATLDAASGQLFARVGSSGAFAASPMTFAGGALHGQLPAAPCGSVIQYYVQASTASGLVLTDPSDAAAHTFSVLASEVDTSFADNFETNEGWTVGAPGDTATTGVWVRADPVGTAAQPEDDNPAGTGTMCYITGNAPAGSSVGTNDVDGGATTLTSPTLDCSGAGEAYVSYYRWYSNDQGSAPNEDSMPVMISSDDGATWTQLELVTENANAWVHKVFRVADFVAPTAQVRLRFVARDLGSGSIVEAGVDDVAAYALDCPASANPADLNNDGAVGAPDLAILLGSWGPCPSGPGCAGDLNGDGFVNAADLAILLGSWG